MKRGAATTIFAKQQAILALGLGLLYAFCFTMGIFSRNAMDASQPFTEQMSAVLGGAAWVAPNLSMLVWCVVVNAAWLALVLLRGFHPFMIPAAMIGMILPAVASGFTVSALVYAYGPRSALCVVVVTVCELLFFACRLRLYLWARIPDDRKGRARALLPFALVFAAAVALSVYGAQACLAALG